jgi:hypothetical protein
MTSRYFPHFTYLHLHRQLVARILPNRWTGRDREATVTMGSPFFRKVVASRSSNSSSRWSFQGSEVYSGHLRTSPSCP